MKQQAPAGGAASGSVPLPCWGSKENAGRGEALKAGPRIPTIFLRTLKDYFYGAQEQAYWSLKEKQQSRQAGNLSSCPKESGRGKEKVAASELRAWRSTTRQ